MRSQQCTVEQILPVTYLWCRQNANNLSQNQRNQHKRCLQITVRVAHAARQSPIQVCQMPNHNCRDALQNSWRRYVSLYATDNRVLPVPSCSQTCQAATEECPWPHWQNRSPQRWIVIVLSWCLRTFVGTQRCDWLRSLLDCLCSLKDTKCNFIVASHSVQNVFVSRVHHYACQQPYKLYKVWKVYKTADTAINGVIMLAIY